MIYKSTGHSEKQQMHKKAFKKNEEEKTAELITAIGPENLKTAEEIPAIFWPNRSFFPRDFLPQFFLPLVVSENEKIPFYLRPHPDYTLKTKVEF